MLERNLNDQRRILGKDLIRYFILIYWTLFWLLNIVDKAIGGAHFLFVGKDRFAQIERFFDSLGLGEPIVANVALIITAGLETFAFVFFAGALYHFAMKNIEATRSWFFFGIANTLITYTYFSVGDQVFGDHFELLEHGLFWFIALLSWIIFIRVDKIQHFDNFSIGKKQFYLSAIIVTFLTAASTFSIFRHNHTSFFERTRAVNAVQITSNKFKIQFPFLAGSTAFENSIEKFTNDHPTKKITYIYTAPKALRLGESDGLIIYIQTEEK
ncbi:MAG: hypothetical protein GC193_08635 [Cryomorphaceae bacterium]|nr:hypothetical protein [Cryomorphaceae bacterium]